MFVTESYIVNNAQPTEIKKMEPGEQPRNEHVNLRAHAPLDLQPEDEEKKINAG